MKDYTKINEKLEAVEIAIFSFSLVHDILHEARDREDAKLTQYIEDALGYAGRKDLILGGDDD